jgi:hypothetical protein
MNPLKRPLLALFIGSCAWQLANGQDYIGYVEQLAAQAGQQAQMHAQNAITAYRQQTGDWSTPDQQVFEYLDAMSRQQNPGFYSDLTATGTGFSGAAGSLCRQ